MSDTATPDAVDYSRLAREYLVQALYGLDGGHDVISLASAAVAALRIEAGELPADELSIEAPPCSCPETLRVRGGHRGSCLVHGTSHTINGEFEGGAPDA